MINKNIDNGKAFDWGKTSENYARYRDIYPQRFFEELYRLGFGREGERCLDIGTGTGVLPRYMHRYGAKLFGIDAVRNQIKTAYELSKGTDIEYMTACAEAIPYGDAYFDAVSAAQCFDYFDREKAVPEIARVLKDNGILIIAYLQWLPDEEEIIDRSLKLVKTFNPDWNYYADRIAVEKVPLNLNGFRKKEVVEFDSDLPFTYESWNGRMIACRGMEPSLTKADVERFSKEHLEMLKSITHDNFTLKHQTAIFCFEKE